MRGLKRFATRCRRRGAPSRNPSSGCGRTRPTAFRRQERAVTPEDYAEVAERHAEVQRAAATFRWTGSWHTVFLTVDRLGGLPVDEDFERQMRRHMERYRMAGYDLEVDGPRFVPLEIELHVCVRPDYFRSSVKAALLEVFSSRSLPDGRRGVFHPDNFTFGQPVYLSRLIAAAQAVAGVESVRATKFQRQGRPSVDGARNGPAPNRQAGNCAAGQRPQFSGTRRVPPGVGRWQMNGSVSPSLRGLDDCGCGAGRSVPTPVAVVNRPGLAAIAYRVGTHAQFRQSLLAGLSSRAAAGPGRVADSRHG